MGKHTRMPELAEVETLKRYLKSNILGQNIVAFKKNRENLRYELDANICNMTESSSIIDIERRAKFLNIKLSNGNSLVVHLGMSGRLTFRAENYQTQKHDHIQIYFVSGNQLVFNDARRFGMIYVCNSNEFEKQTFLKNMGVEPLTEEFSFVYLKNKLQNKKSPIKTTLMDRKYLCSRELIYCRN
jgi:formamidopyrimidine-DNA glycosylase